MAKLTFATGRKSYEIEDENGNHLCDISFNTTDLNVMNKLLNMQEEVKKVIPDIKNFESDDEAIDFLKSDVVVKADKDIRAIIDNAFDSDICSELFGNANCLSVGTDGTTLVERFLNMVAPAIAGDYKEAMEASDKRIKKYTSQVK